MEALAKELESARHEYALGMRRQRVERRARRRPRAVQRDGDRVEKATGGAARF